MEMVLRKPSLIIAGRRFSKVGSPGSLAPSSPPVSDPPPHRRLPPANTPQDAKTARASAVLVAKDLVLIEG